MAIATKGQRVQFVDHLGKTRPAVITAVHPPEVRRVVLEDESKLLPGDRLPSRHPRPVRLTLDDPSDLRESDQDVYREQVPAEYSDDPEDDRPPVLVRAAYERITVTRQMEVLVVTREVRPETVDLLYSPNGVDHSLDPTTALTKFHALHRSQQAPTPLVGYAEPQLRSYWVEEGAA